MSESQPSKVTHLVPLLIVAAVLAVIVDFLLFTRARVNPITSQINPRAYGLFCKLDKECHGLVSIDCGAAVDGPLYYVDKKTGSIVGECGGLCFGPQPGKCLPGTCPSKEWTCGSNFNTSPNSNSVLNTNSTSTNAAKPVVVDPKDEASCLAQGGEWGRLGQSLEERCNPATSDAGKTCSGSDECQGSCIAQLTKDQEVRVVNGLPLKTTGICTRLKYNFGCLAWVEKGVVDQILCAD